MVGGDNPPACRVVGDREPPEIVAGTGVAPPDQPRWLWVEGVQDRARLLVPTVAVPLDAVLHIVQQVELRVGAVRQVHHEPFGEPADAVGLDQCFVVVRQHKAEQSLSPRPVHPDR
jgi:hypothetical protein